MSIKKRKRKRFRKFVLESKLKKAVKVLSARGQRTAGWGCRPEQ